MGFGIVWTLTLFDTEESKLQKQTNKWYNGITTCDVHNKQKRFHVLLASKKKTETHMCLSIRYLFQNISMKNDILMSLLNHIDHKMSSTCDSNVKPVQLHHHFFKVPNGPVGLATTVGTCACG